MNITFIRSNTHAVGEYRINHPAKQLAAMGHQCNQIILDTGPQRVANAELAGDVLVLQRQTSASVLELWKTLPEEQRPVLVYELDDNPWEWHSWDAIHTSLGYQYGKLVKQIMGECAAVTCSTRMLAERVRREFPQMPVWVVPNAIDFNLRDWSAREDRAEHDLADRLVLGWTGSVHHSRDGGEMLAALPTILHAYPEAVFLMQCDRTVYYEWTARLVKKGFGDQLRWVPPQPFDWHPRIYSLFDVNLAPLEGTAFNRCKSDLRLIEGGAHGVPYVASKIAPYLEFHAASDGIGGHLADRSVEWVEGISNLLDGEREARGNSLARYVVSTRHLAVVGGMWETAFQGAIAKAAGTPSLPVADVTRNAPCPCASGLKYKRCCSPAYG